MGEQLEIFESSSVPAPFPLHEVVQYEEIEESPEPTTSFLDETGMLRLELIQ